MKLSDVFAKAKPLLSTTWLQGICSAIEGTTAPDVDVIKAKAIIASKLDGWAYASSWLGANVLYGGKVSYQNVTTRQLNLIHEWRRKQSVESIQAWRHAWLDQLIEEFKAKGM